VFRRNDVPGQIERALDDVIRTIAAVGLRYGVDHPLGQRMFVDERRHEEPPKNVGVLRLQ
jgi:hypothetical protein